MHPGAGLPPDRLPATGRNPGACTEIMTGALPSTACARMLLPASSTQIPIAGRLAGASITEATNRVSVH
jgi:hypothetical protein